MKVKQTVTLPHEDLEWFNKEYPNGNLSWVLTMLLREFKKIHQDVGATPKRISKDSAKELKQQMDEGVFEESEEEEEE